MNDAIARVYALQQRELNEKERQRQQQLAKSQRIVSAFNTSGLPAIFNQFRELPLRTDVRQRVYKQTVGELTWNANTPANQLYTMSFVAINGSTSGPRWWCEENADSGYMRYGYSSGMTGDRGTFFDRPQGEWLDRFVEYLAAATDPAVVAEKLSESQSHSTRRQLQPV